jgi:tellurite resistance protein TerC
MAWLWIGFVGCILALLALDLGVFNRKAHAIGAREALGWTAVWVAFGAAFGAVVYLLYDHHVSGLGAAGGQAMSGGQAALLYFTGYLVEKSLSLDNIFVIAAIFAYFSTPAQSQHRALFWGILGALVMRGAMVAAGTALIHQFSWATYAFGALLLFAAVKMLRSADGPGVEPGRNPLVLLARRFLPISGNYDGCRFFTRAGGRLAATPLLIAVIVIESSDILFAVDSVPAVLAITSDPFLVYTSNVFAVLGLRSLYFALAAMMGKFRYLNISLAAVLAFVGVKMLAARWIEISALASLAVIAAVIATGVLASSRGRRR